MIKMSYPESITLLALNQFHGLLASNIITMAQESAPAAPLMTPTQIAHQNNRDKAIRRNNCTFLLRIRLLAPLPDILTINDVGVYSVPAVFDVNDLRRFSAFLTDDVKTMCLGGGLSCVALEPHAHYTYVIVQGDESGYDLSVPWDAMLQRCELEEKAVLSMWGFYDDEGRPRFIFRHDGYAGLGEELPPLTDMNVVDPPLQDQQQGQDNQVHGNPIINQQQGQGNQVHGNPIINQQQGQGRRCSCCNVG